MLLRFLLLAAALPLLLQGAAAATPSVPAAVASTGPRLLSGRALSSDRALLSFDPSTVGTGLLTCLSPGHQLEMLITSSKTVWIAPWRMLTMRWAIVLLMLTPSLLSLADGASIRQSK